jgi:hypothetical protein
MVRPNGDSFWRIQRQKAALKQAEADGVVADSLEVRKELVRQFEAKQITFEEMQAKLAKIKRDAKKNGKVTRNQAFQGQRP